MIARATLECCSRDCPRRKSGCQVSCEDYKTAKAKDEAEKLEIRRKKAKEHLLDDFAVESLLNSRKRNGQTKR